MSCSKVSISPWRSEEAGYATRLVILRSELEVRRAWIAPRAATAFLRATALPELRTTAISASTAGSPILVRAAAASSPGEVICLRAVDWRSRWMRRLSTGRSSASAAINCGMAGSAASYCSPSQYAAPAASTGLLEVSLAARCSTWARPAAGCLPRSGWTAAKHDAAAITVQSRREHFRILPPSLVAQRHHGINARGASPGDITGQRCHQRQDQRQTSVCNRVGGANSEQQAGDGPSRGQGKHQPDPEPDQRQPERLPHHHAQDIGAARS